jgi:DNA-binding PadR family transcriptional regulator
VKGSEKVLIEYELELTERDKDVMKGIAKTKLLTVDQIKRLYFNLSDHVYRRMKQLEKAGFVTSRPHVERKTGRKIGTCYYLTEMGFNLIGQEHYNPRLLIEPRKHDYRVKVSEIFTQLTPIGWEFKANEYVPSGCNGPAALLFLDGSFLGSLFLLFFSSFGG